jgi:DNA primase
MEEASTEPALPPLKLRQAGTTTSRAEADFIRLIRQQNTRMLLLCESVIDAATLLPLELDCSVLALYGTNGLSEEHQLVIRKLTSAYNEVILAMDGDEAGRQAGEQIARAIKKIRSSVKISRLEIAEGEDVNSLAVAHSDTQGLFTELIENRKEIVIKEKEEKPVVPSKLRHHQSQ